MWFDHHSCCFYAWNWDKLLLHFPPQLWNDLYLSDVNSWKYFLILCQWQIYQVVKVEKSQKLYCLGNFYSMFTKGWSKKECGWAFKMVMEHFKLKPKLGKLWNILVHFLFVIVIFVCQYYLRHAGSCVHHNIVVKLLVFFPFINWIMKLSCILITIVWQCSNVDLTLSIWISVRPSFLLFLVNIYSLSLRGVIFFSWWKSSKRYFV